MNTADYVYLLAGATLPGFVVAWLAGYIVRRNAGRWGLVDQPGQRKMHVTPTPLGGGIAIWLGLVVPLALGQLVLWLFATDPDHVAAWLPALVAKNAGGLWQRSGQLWTLVGLGTVLATLGLYDDRWHLAWPLRLGIEALVALAAVLAGWQFTLFINLPGLTAAVTVLWIVGLVNSFNMLDNMDGLSGGVAAISAGMFGLVVLLVPETVGGPPQLFVAGMLLVLVGAVLGFLVHNRPPARLFMGDAGSYLLGFWLAMATVLATFAGHHKPHTILAPLCVLAVPLYDTISVVLVRLRRGLSPFEADKNHFSHRLVQLGMTPRQAVLLIYLLTFTSGLGAVLLYQVQTAGSAAVVVLLVICVLAVVALLEAAAARKVRQTAQEE